MRLAGMFIAASLACGGSFAADLAAPEPSWRDECRAGAHAFTLSFASRSGDAYEDDMSIEFARDGARVTLPLEPGLYQPRGLLANVTNLCRRAAALEVGPSQVLLLLSRNGRPGWDVLDLVLVDLATARVLDTSAALGSIKTVDRVIVARREGPAALAVRLIREDIADSGCDCEAAAIEDWMRVDIVDDRIRAAWR